MYRLLLYANRDDKGSTLVVTILVLVILSILGTAALTLTNTELLIARNMKLNSKAFYLAEAGIEEAKRVLQRQSLNVALVSNNGTLISDKSLGGGEYTVQVTDNDNDDELKILYSDDIVWLKSTGSYRSGQEDISVLLYRQEVPFFADGALSIYTQNASVSIGGSSEIDGDDYHVPVDFSCQGVGCSGSIGSMNGTDGVYFEYNDYKLNDNSQGKGKDPSKNINPYPVKTGGGNSTKNDYWIDFAQRLIPKADSTVQGSIASTETLGTRSSPEITVVNGTSTINGNVDGAGILIVQAGSHMTGTFHFEGLVIQLVDEDDPNADLFSTGTPNVFGTVIVAGSGSANVDLTGNPEIKYSYEALLNVNNNLNINPEVIAWKNL